MPAWLLWLIWLLPVFGIGHLRNRVFALFVGALLGILCLVWTALTPHISLPARVLLALFQLQVFFHFSLLVRPRLRPSWFRGIVNLPALWFVTATLLAIPWAIAASLGHPPHGMWIPGLICVIGLLQSLINPIRHQEVLLETIDAGPLQRWHRPTPGPESAQDTALHIIQITDAHLGPFMSEGRLKRVCERAVAANPDLVLLTGDFITMESRNGEEALVRALAPLKAIQGKTFACLGNHDYEAIHTVVSALERTGILLLVDRDVHVDTPIGPVQIIGADFVHQRRKKHLETLFSRIAPRQGAPRILLLHDPGAFRHVPDGEADLTLSGHTHGGHVGFLSFGIKWTVVKTFARIPDNGFWAMGRNRLYVHRGTGHYGFPLRLGVPGEEGSLHVRFPAAPS